MERGEYEFAAEFMFELPFFLKNRTGISAAFRSKAALNLLRLEKKIKI